MELSIVTLIVAVVALLVGIIAGKFIFAKERNFLFVPKGMFCSRCCESMFPEMVIMLLIDSGHCHGVVIVLHLFH